MKDQRLEAIKRKTRPFLLPEEVAYVLKTDPQNIRVAARQRPELLGFPVIIVGNRVKIPRIPFMNLVFGGSNE